MLLSYSPYFYTFSFHILYTTPLPSSVSCLLNNIPLAFYPFYYYPIFILLLLPSLFIISITIMSSQDSIAEVLKRVDKLDVKSHLQQPAGNPSQLVPVSSQNRTLILRVSQEGLRNLFEDRKVCFIKQ